MQYVVVAIMYSKALGQKDLPDIYSQAQGLVLTYYIRDSYSAIPLGTYKEGYKPVKVGT